METDFEMMEKSAKKMAASVDRAKTAAAKKAARQQVADRLASTAAQRGMTGPAAAKMLGRLSVAAGIGITAAEIAQALRKKKKAGEESSARASRLAADSASKSVKPKEGQSPTDAMRSNMQGRISTGVSKPVANKTPMARPKSAPKETFGQAFAAARKAGKNQFMYNGKPYTTRTKEEEDKLKASTNKTESSTRMERKDAIRNRRGAGGTSSAVESRVAQLEENKRRANKAYGGGMKTVKRQSGSQIAKNKKPRGVGCAKSGYGKAMKK